MRRISRSRVLLAAVIACLMTFALAACSVQSASDGSTGANADSTAAAPSDGSASADTGASTTASSPATYTQISQEEARELMQLEDIHIIVDVRTQDEYNGGHIPGAICIPNETIGTEPPAELPDMDVNILVYCRSGNRSKQAAQKLADMGYTHVYEFGGINSWTGEIVTGETTSDE